MNEHPLDDVSMALLYAHGELDAHAAEALRVRMASDAGLRQLVLEATEARQRVFTAIADLDRHERLAVSELAAVRTGQRAIRDALEHGSQQQAAAMRLPMVSAAPRRWWLYPVAAAACLALATLGWWSQMPIPNQQLPGSGVQVARVDPVESAGQSDLASLISRSLAVFPESESVEDRLEYGERLLADAQTVAGQAFWEREQWSY